VTDTRPVWTPSPAQAASANVSRFIRDVVRPLGGAAAAVHDAHTLHAWSVAHPSDFWPAVWGFCGVIADELGADRQWGDVLVGGDRVAPPDPVLGPRWFTGARLNFAENLLRRRDDADALVLWTESGRGRSHSFAALARDV
jgi:acetoacetyl-CoA synthetase